MIPDSLLSNPAFRNGAYGAAGVLLFLVAVAGSLLVLWASAGGALAVLSVLADLLRFLARRVRQVWAPRIARRRGCVCDFDDGRPLVDEWCRVHGDPAGARERAAERYEFERRLERMKAATARAVAEIEAARRERDLVVVRVQEATAAAFAGNPPGKISGTVPCPVCGGTIEWEAWLSMRRSRCPSCALDVRWSAR